MAAKARMSLGRQPPPNPSPGTRNRPPIRLSCASASASGTMSAPAASHISAIALMNETLVARNALAAPLTSSAVGRSVTRNGTPAASGWAYTSRSRASARSEVTPATIRSGRTVSATACPSRRNSGFQASSAAAPTGASRVRRSASSAAVPTGTVDFPTSRQGRVSRGARASTHASRCDRSAAAESVRCGVPTHTKWMSPNSAASA